eukprot:2642472-Rhodomonas_salina.1
MAQQRRQEIEETHWLKLHLGTSRTMSVLEIAWRMLRMIASFTSKMPFLLPSGSATAAGRVDRGGGGGGGGGGGRGGAEAMIDAIAEQREMSTGNIHKGRVEQGLPGASGDVFSCSGE